MGPSEALETQLRRSRSVLLEPVIKPLGYDWRIGIGLVGSFAAREVFVSTMSIVFNIEGDGEDDHLREAFKKAAVARSAAAVHAFIVYEPCCCFMSLRCSA
jgi:ferrous iron transport protein B